MKSSLLQNCGQPLDKDKLILSLLLNLMSYEMMMPRHYFMRSRVNSSASWVSKFLPSRLSFTCSLKKPVNLSENELLWKMSNQNQAWTELNIFSIFNIFFWTFYSKISTRTSFNYLHNLFSKILPNFCRLVLMFTCIIKSH